MRLWIVLTAFFAAFLMSAAPAEAQGFNCANAISVPQSECAVLVAIYQNNGGSQWVTKTNWMTALNVCSWAGITCTGGHITQLWLSNIRMTGDFPDASGLPHLTHFVPQSNGNLNPGPVPQWLIDKTGLTLLSFAHTNRTGELPHFASAPTLTSLSFERNLLETISPEYNRTNYPVLNYFEGLWNRFTDLPVGVATLTGINTVWHLNRLQPSEHAVIDWLNANDPPWNLIQIVPPEDFQAPIVEAEEITFAWSLVAPGALDDPEPGYYEIGLSTTPGGPYQFKNAWRTSDRSTSQITLRNLLPGTDYYAVIRTVQKSYPWVLSQYYALWPTITSVDSAEIMVSTLPVPTKPGTPSLSAPALDAMLIDTASPVLAWSPSLAGDPATKFKVKILNAVTNIVVFSQTVTPGVACSPDCTLALGATKLLNGDYKWNVTASNAVGNSKSATHRFSIQVPGTPTNLLPTGGTVVFTQPSFTWDELSNAAEYRVVVTHTASGSKLQTDWLESGDPGLSCASSTCTADFDVLSLSLKKGAHKWMVQARNKALNNSKTKSAKAQITVQIP